MNMHSSQMPIDRRQLLLDDLKTIFHQLSGMEKEEMNDQASFLEMGFDSLFLTQAVAKIKKKLPVKINFRQLFEEAPNFIALANYLDQQLPEDFYQEEIQQQQKALPSSEPLLDKPAPTPPPTQSPISTLPSLSTQNREGIEGIIEQQLLLMQQQLALLGQVPQTSRAPPGFLYWKFGTAAQWCN